MGALITCGKTSTTVICSEHLKISCRVLQRNKDQEQTIRQQVSQPASAGKGAYMSELRTCDKRVGGLAVTTLPQARNQEGRKPPKIPFAAPGKYLGHSLKILVIV